MTVFLWGILATSSLVIGGFIGSTFKIGKKTLGVIMAFGAGVLISAIAYELVYEAVISAKLTGIPLISMITGAFAFFMADRLIGKYGTDSRKDMGSSGKSALVVPMVLAIVMDGIPESTVIGLGILETGSVSLTMLVAVFISNLPEAIAGSSGMKSSGWSRKKILLLWMSIAIVCAVFTVMGYAFFENASGGVFAFINAFAAGAMLMMLANTMMPEAFEHGGKLAGVFTVLGFIVSVSMIVLEHS